jgi:hypothetical protein
MRRVAGGLIWQRGSVPLKGYDAKIRTYSAWDHDGHIVPLAFDSAGAIAPKSAAFIKKLYVSTDDDGVKREWN